MSLEKKNGALLAIHLSITIYRRILFNGPTHIKWSDYKVCFISWQTGQQSPMFQSVVSGGLHILVSLTAVNTRLLLTIFKEGAGNGL